MTGTLFSLLEKGTLRRWDRAAAQTERLDTPNLKALRKKARQLERKLNRVVNLADSRLSAGGSAAISRPMNSDWAWRPELWCGPVKAVGQASVRSKAALGQEVKLFHDCPLAEISVRQVDNKTSRDVAPYGMRVDVFRFEGSFLSLAIDFPFDALVGLSKRHIIRAAIGVETERPLSIFGRLNVKNGPNVEHSVQVFDQSARLQYLEFDASVLNVDETRIERAWFDLIFNEPDMNAVLLRDITFSRRPRAEV